MNRKELLITNRYLQENRVIKWLKIKKIAKEIDWFLGWGARYIWSHKISVVPEKVLFISFNKQYTCNPKYICKELIRRGVKCDIVWLTCDDKNAAITPFPACIRQVKIGTVDAFREILSAHIIVQNAHLSQEYGFLPKKKGQYYIQTWHGAIGFKRFDARSDRNKKRVLAAKRAGKHTDLFLSNSGFETKFVAPVFWKRSTIVETGHARNDILINYNDETVNKLRKKLALEQDLHYVLYAPTFRDDKSDSHFKIDYQRLISAVEKRFGGKWGVLVKYHYSNRNEALKIEGDWRVFNVSRYPDIQELMLVADVGITDYSSWILDFILTKKPAFLYADDIKEYENERGFYYPLKTTPFSIAENNDQLEENIGLFDKDVYTKKVSDFLIEKACVENGTAACVAVDIIKKELEKYEKAY